MMDWGWEILCFNVCLGWGNGRGKKLQGRERDRKENTFTFDYE
jgi:hypothetical protein